MPRVLTKPQLAQLEHLLTQKHRWQLKVTERIHASHVADDHHETLTVDVVDGPLVFRWEARAPLSTPHAVDLLMDFLDGILDEWFKNGRDGWPTLDFSPYTFGGTTLGLRGGKRRPDLEAQADALLASAGFVDDE